jgi:hypothetical protein
LPGCPSMASPNLPGLSAGFARAQGARYVVAAISAAMGDRRLPRPAPPRLGLAVRPAAAGLSVRVLVRTGRAGAWVPVGVVPAPLRAAALSPACNRNRVPVVDCHDGP